MDLEIFDKDTAVIIVEYAHGMDVGRTGMDWYHKSDVDIFVKSICELAGFGTVDLREIKERLRTTERDYQFALERLRALEYFVTEGYSEFNLKLFYQDNVTHEAVVRHNMGR